jgi:hypothetical protein
MVLAPFELCDFKQLLSGIQDRFPTLELKEQDLVQFKDTNKIVFRLPDIAQMIQEISHFEV